MSVVVVAAATAATNNSLRAQHARVPNRRRVGALQNTHTHTHEAVRVQSGCGVVGECAGGGDPVPPGAGVRRWVAAGKRALSSVWKMRMRTTKRTQERACAGTKFTITNDDNMAASLLSWV